MPENTPIEANEEEAEPKHTEPIEEAKPKAKAKATPKKLPRSVRVVELVECNDCGRKMTPKSLKHTHPHYCKGAPNETLPVNKQKASYGTKVEERLRKEIEAEMKAKYDATQSRGIRDSKENDKNVQNVQNVPSVPSVPTRVVKMEEAVRQPTATELLQQSYNEMKRLKQLERQEKISRLKLGMF